MVLALGTAWQWHRRAAPVLACPPRLPTTSPSAGRRHPAAFPAFLTVWEVPREKEGRFESEKAEKRSLGMAVNGPHGSQCPRNSLCAAQRGGC